MIKSLSCPRNTFVATLLYVSLGFSIEPPVLISLTAQDWPTYTVTWRNSDPTVDSIAVYRTKSMVLASKIRSPGADGAYTENFQNFSDSACYALQAFAGTSSSVVSAVQCILSTPAPVDTPALSLLGSFTVFEKKDTISVKYTTGFPKADSSFLHFSCSAKEEHFPVPITSAPTDTAQTKFPSKLLESCFNEPVSIWVKSWKGGLPISTSHLDLLLYDRSAFEATKLNRDSLGVKYSTILSGGSNEGTYLVGDTLFAKEGLPNGLSMYLVSDLTHPHFLGIRYTPLYSIQFSAEKDTIVTVSQSCNSFPREHCTSFLNFLTSSPYGYDTIATSTNIPGIDYVSTNPYQMINGHSAMIVGASGIVPVWLQITRAGRDATIAAANIAYSSGGYYSVGPFTLSDPWIFAETKINDINLPIDPVTQNYPEVKSNTYVFPNGFSGNRYVGTRALDIPQGKVVGGLYFTDSVVTNSASAQLLGDSAISLTFSGHTDFYAIKKSDVGVQTPRKIPSPNPIATIYSFNGKILEENVRNVPAALQRLNSGILQVVIITSANGAKRYMVGK